MLNKEASAKAIRRLFNRTRVVEIDDLFRTLQTRSRMSVFRRLRIQGYLSSYTHSGRYYTLSSIPAFDEHGLWFWQAVGFSRAGTLKATLVGLVDSSEAGHTHGELGRIARVRVQNTLLATLREGLVGRERIGDAYLYVSANEVRGSEQVDRRRLLRKRARDVAPLAPIVVIDVLTELVQAGGIVVHPSIVVSRLCARGIVVAIEQVELVYQQQGLVAGKKTAPSKRSRS